jgi:2',3'-cyclic-nucleotide 2'-phosphodiesterase (5'-nucleotidase family)
MAEFTLQLLHAADQEGGVPAIDDAPRFSAVLNALKEQDADDDGVADYENTLVLSSGDAYIPGPFFSASETVYGAAGWGDILIQNELGFQAIAFGNHEFDLGTGTVASLISADAEAGYPGTAFPYLSSNLDFSTDEDLAGLVVEDGEASTIPNSIAASTVITVNGEQIGVVGATTPTLPSISSPGGVTVLPTEFDASNPDDIAALAAEIQQDVDALLAANPDINKVVLLSHMQQIAIEEALAGQLRNVDIIVAGGSNTLLADDTDTLRAGDEAEGPYPILKTDADGNPVAVVNTDGNYKYVGRLVVDFDAAGVIIPDSVDAAVSGAYATDEAGVAAVNGTPDPEVVEIVNALADVIAAQEGNIFGSTDVFLNGTRGDVRTQETNLGNLTADANLAYAQSIDPDVVISIKNGGGIRDDIGEVIVPPGATGPEDFLRVPPQPNDLAGKEEGDISQLDIQNTLRFNNGLTLLTVTAQELFDIIEHGVAATAEGATPGQFPQVAGIAFSFDDDLPPGDRVQSLAITDDNGDVVDVVVEDGELVGAADRTFRLVTLSFLAGGGDDYPFPDRDRVDLVTEDSDVPDPDSRTGDATFAPDGSEQDVLAEYLLDNFSDDAFDNPDTPPAEDTRIQNLDFREDTVLTDVPTDGDGDTPMIPESPEVQLTAIGTYETGVFDEGAAEIVDYDPVTQRLFVVNGDTKAIDILDLSTPGSPTKLGEISVTDFGAGPNSVAVKNGIVAIAVEAEAGTEPGQAVFFTTDGEFLNAVTVGVLPDLITFTPDGMKVLTANEAEPVLDDDDNLIADPESSISIIDLSGGVENLTDADVTNADFTAFNGMEAELQAAGVRLFPGRSAAADLEPEYIAVSPDGTTAFVTLQENNAVAIVDIAAGTVVDVKPLGTKDWSTDAELDASDRDGGINFQNWPVFGLYQPDTIASFETNGQTYYITANEGDARDEDTRVEDVVLDPTAFPNADELQLEENLGRLEISSIDGDTDGDGDYDQLFTYGGRSFAIWDSQGNLVFESGDDIGKITAELTPELFNANDGDPAEFDARSDAKGAEPEGVTTGVLNGQVYAFVGLERSGGGVLVYNVTDPTNPEFLQYARTEGDIAPEGLKFISPEESPTGRALLAVTNEVSGTTTLYDFGSIIPGVDGVDNADTVGTEANDLIEAGDGNNTAAGELGADIILGGDGNDILRGDLNKKSAQGDIGDDDIIRGGAGNDRIGGKGGNDDLYGDAGNDQIWGDNGDDLIQGGLGVDKVFGGAGSDIFFLTVGEGFDQIRDFSFAEGDTIRLPQEISIADLTFSSVGIGAEIALEDDVLATIRGVSAEELVAAADQVFIV